MNFVLLRETASHFLTTLTPAGSYFRVLILVTWNLLLRKLTRASVSDACFPGVALFFIGETFAVAEDLGGDVDDFTGGDSGIAG